MNRALCAAVWGLSDNTNDAYSSNSDITAAKKNELGENQLVGGTGKSMKSRFLSWIMHEEIV